MNIHFIQHVPFLGPGIIKVWAEARDSCISFTRLFDKEKLPDSSSLDALVILGGDLNISGAELTSTQIREKKFIRRCIQQNKLVLGINLGARLIASVLGGRIMPNKIKKIGWYLVNWNSNACRHPMFNFLPFRHLVLYWHKDTYELPSGAVSLAGSSHCRNQAFMYGQNVLALQFHLELDYKGLEQLIVNHKGDLKERGAHIQSAEHMLSRLEYLDSSNRMLTRLLDQFLLGKLDAAGGMISTS